MLRLLFSPIIFPYRKKLKKTVFSIYKHFVQIWLFVIFLMYRYFLRIHASDERLQTRGSLDTWIGIDESIAFHDKGSS
jgi:hypothetical protein